MAGGIWTGGKYPGEKKDGGNIQGEWQGEMVGGNVRGEMYVLLSLKGLPISG